MKRKRSFLNLFWNTTFHPSTCSGKQTNKKPNPNRKSHVCKTWLYFMGSSVAHAHSQMEASLPGFKRQTYVCACLYRQIHTKLSTGPCSLNHAFSTGITLLLSQWKWFSVARGGMWKTPSLLQWSVALQRVIVHKETYSICVVLKFHGWVWLGGKNLKKVP